MKMSPVVTFLVVLSVLVNVAVAIGFVFIAIGLGRNSSNLRADQVTQCQESNVVRVQDIAIWNRLLQVPPGASAGQKREAAELAALVKAKDTPKDCAQIYSAASSH